MFIVKVFALGQGGRNRVLFVKWTQQGFAATRVA